MSYSSNSEGHPSLLKMCSHLVGCFFIRVIRKHLAVVLVGSPWRAASWLMICQLDSSASHFSYKGLDSICSWPRKPILSVVPVIWQSMSLARARSSSGMLISISSLVCFHVPSLPAPSPVCLAMPSCMGWWVAKASSLAVSHVCLLRKSSDSSDWKWSGNWSDSSGSDGSSSAAISSRLHWCWHLRQK